MNITETAPPEKAKRKAKPRIDRYSQNEAFAVMLFSLMIIFLFHMIWRISAIALISQLSTVVMLVSAGGTFIFFLLLGRWGYFPVLASWFLAIFSGIIILSMGKAFLGVAFLSIMLLIVTIPILLVSVTAILFYALALLASMDDIKQKLYRPMKILALLFLLSALSIANSMTYGSVRFEPINHISIDDTNYYLVLDRGFLDPVQVQLYECNHLSINCERTYSTYDNFGPSFNFDRFRDTAEMHQGDHDNILVLVDGEVVYDSSEGSP